MRTGRTLWRNEQGRYEICDYPSERDSRLLMGKMTAILAWINEQIDPLGVRDGVTGEPSDPSLRLLWVATEESQKANESYSAGEVVWCVGDDLALCISDGELYEYRRSHPFWEPAGPEARLAWVAIEEERGKLRRRKPRKAKP